MHTHQNKAGFLSHPVINHMRILTILIFLILSVTTAGAEGNPAQPSESKVPGHITLKIPDAQNAVIGKIFIENQNVFDLDNPLENRWLYRIANALHIRTRPQVIRRQLLFTEGDVYSAHDIEESARILRSNDYIKEAIIKPVRYKNGVVDLNVKTTDVWTFSPGVSFGRNGGANKTSFDLEEQNLLGTGTSIRANYNSTIDRDVKALSFANKHIGGSLYEAAAMYADNSDGFERFLRFGQPFFSLDSRKSIIGSVLSSQRVDSIYDRGKVVTRFDHKLEHYEMDIGWSRGLKAGWARRLTTGIVYDDHEFSALHDDAMPKAILPRDRQYLFPYLGFEIIEDKFETVKNFNQIHETEDLHMGTRFKVRLGYSNEAAGSSDSGFHINGKFSNGIRFVESGTLLYGWQFSGRFVSGNSENVRLSAYSKYYWRQSPHWMLYGGLESTVGTNLDPDNQLLLGGDNGLRGYPIRYQSGNAAALLTIEQRVFTDWYPFRLVRVGGAVFFDAGRTWGNNLNGTENLGLLKDIGIGLRIGNSRSGIGRMIHIDLAFPLDGESDIKGAQWSIETKIGF